MTTDTASASAGTPAEDIEKLHHITTIPEVAATADLLRHRLLDVIKVYGPITTSQLADRTGHQAHVLAYHLGVLHDAHLIEQTARPADEPDARPWRLAAATNRILTNDLPDDPVSKAVMLAAHLVHAERRHQVLAGWFSARESFAEEWRVSAYGDDTWLWLSPAELIQLSGQIHELFDHWAHRDVLGDNVDRRPFFITALAARAEP